jgi:hypothetical protein
MPAKKYPRSVGHYEEWINAAKGQGDGCGSDFEKGNRSQKFFHKKPKMSK